MDAVPTPPPARGRSLSLILPAYNEAAGIAAAVAEADDALAAFCPDYEILVVDDGSSDGTADAVEAVIPERPRVRLLRHPVNRGYGAALRTGFTAARGERVAFTDADAQFDLADLEHLLYLCEDCPVVAGYRIDRQDPPLRRFGSWGYNQLARRLLGTRVRDCDCALKVFRRDALAALVPESTGFFVNSEMLTRARQQGLAVAEVGVRHRPRRFGSSKVSWRDVPRTLAVLLPFWWSRVLFARDDGQSPRVATRGLSPALPLLLILASLLFFCRLRTPLLEPEETRYAEIPRQMLAAGQWLVPTLHGQPYLDKPPLFYWMVMASYRLFGVHDWSARLVPGLAGVLTVLTVYGWGRRALGPRAALAAALMLCLSPEFVYRARMLTMNGLLGLCVTAALAAGHLAMNAPGLRWRFWLAAAAACGLGLLAKGPVAVALVAPPLVAAGWLDHRLARVGGRGWVAFAGVALAVAGPWYAAVAVRESAFGSYFFWTHNVLRYVAPLDHEEPAWFYLPSVLLGMLPWTLLLVPLARLLARRKAAVAARRPGALGVALLAFAWGLLFFSLAGSKRAGYLVPVLPPLALALGCTLDLALPRARLAWAVDTLWRYRTAAAYWATAVILSAGVAGGGLLAVTARRPDRALALAGPAALGLVYLTIRRAPRRLSWGLTGAAAFALLWVGLNDLLPGYADHFSLRRAVESADGFAARGRDPATAVICYPHRWDSVSFYLGRGDVQAFAPAERPQLMEVLEAVPRAVLFVKTKDHLQELLADLPANLEFVPQRRDGWVTVGLVRPRREAPVAAYAQAGYDGMSGGR